MEMLGAGPIANLSDQTVNAGRCTRAWPLLRDWMLRTHAWNCAVKRVVLSPDITAPAFGFSHAFTLPIDYVRMLEIGDVYDQPAYKIESGKVLADATTLKLRYIWRNDDPTTWDGALVRVMVLAVAAHLAYATTNSASVESTRIDELRRELRAAKSIDGAEEDGEILGDFPLYAARF